MKKIETLEQIKEYIEKEYDSNKVGGPWWEGNLDDSYEYGQENGRTYTLYEIGKLLGMDLPEPNDSDVE